MSATPIPGANSLLNAMKTGVFPVIGTPVYLSLSGTSSETSADLAAGKYLLLADTEFTFIVSSSGGGGTAVWKTSPGIMWNTTPFYLELTEAKRIAAVTGLATGYLMILPIGAVG